jgi:phosphopentomutase
VFAFQRLEQYIRSEATPLASRELSRFVQALKHETEFPLSSLYEIDFVAFELAVDALRDWRIDRYYARPTMVAKATAAGDTAALDEAAA